MNMINPMTNLAGPSSTTEPQENKQPQATPAAAEAQKASAQSPTQQQDTQAVKNVEKAAENNDADFAAKYAALSREQKKLYQEREALRREQDSFKADRERLAELEKKASMWSENKLAFLKDQGTSVEEILKLAVTEGQPPSVEDKLSSIEQRLEAFYKKQEEDLKKAEEAETQKQINAYKSQIKETLSKELDKWEAINQMGLHDEVYELIYETYQKSNGDIVLSIEEAADQVENHVVEHARKLAALKKLQPKIETPPAPLEEKKPEAPKSPLGILEKAASIPATLTTQAVAEPAKKEPQPLLDRDESIRLLAKQLEEKMKRKQQGQ